MSWLEINTKKLGEIYKEWRGNESCYDNGRPVFEADELLDFAQFCLKHEANVIPTGERQSNIPDVSSHVCHTCKGTGLVYIDDVIKNTLCPDC